MATGLTFNDDGSISTPSRTDVVPASPEPLGVSVYNSEQELAGLMELDQQLEARGYPEPPAETEARHQRMTELSEEIQQGRREIEERRGRVQTGAVIEEGLGKEALYEWYSGIKLGERQGSHEYDKTRIWTVNELGEGFDRSNPWAGATKLTYVVGARLGGLTGRSFRPRHPLQGIGTRIGQPVFEEDLFNLSPEFTNLVNSGIPEFIQLSNSGIFDLSITRMPAFRAMISDDKKWDLKSTITSDGTPSYAASVIGEWSFNGDRLRRYDDYGNISYGPFGLAAGFSERALLRGSNLNQVFKLDNSGDEPRDVYMIQMGFDRYVNGAYVQPAAVAVPVE